MENKTFKPLKELGLTKEEIDFVYKVFENPSCKLHNCFHFDEDNTTHVPLWEKPQELGLIECVGSYKWTPTDKISMRIFVEEEVEETFFDRLLIEFKDLEDKINKLEDFVKTDKFSELHEIISDSMWGQLSAMKQYRSHLKTRIDLLDEN